MTKLISVIIVVAIALCIAPMLFLWSVNSLAEAGNIDFYIEHTLFNYFVSLVFIIVVRGNK